MLIRALRPADAAAVDALLAQLGYPQAGPAATAERIEAWTNDPSSAAYAAAVDPAPTGVPDGVAGLVAVHVCPYFERPGAWGRIVALVVSDTVRGNGIGTRLVEAAEAFALERGCVRIEVTSNDRRAGAHAFYRARGYTVQTGHSSRFLRDLTTGPAAPR
ncbi:GNAT family N-acetyltransferase [Glycomyces terrestris]|uniref:GNAT family N-acetyltransferase n=1 Tax=Glycomyces terrestris TaxID=2493553 RepID=UPI001E41CEDA|nr:GNAT family N-acetyltransferase [Glycomyces terrestris]